VISKASTSASVGSPSRRSISRWNRSRGAGRRESPNSESASVDAVVEGDAEVLGFAERVAVVDERPFEVCGMREVVHVPGAEKVGPGDVVVGKRPVPEGQHVRHRPERVRQGMSDGIRVRRPGVSGPIVHRSHLPHL
jgi:hypothetical protein